MFPLDEQMLRTFLRLEEYKRQRVWMERLWHPEKMKWAKGPPRLTEAKMIRQQELAKMGFGEEHYQRMVGGEEKSRAELTELTHAHALWPHFQRINGFQEYLAGGFVAAGGDIQRAPTATSFWYGMGLDVLPDGTVPRRIRGRKDVERRIPALPHVTCLGELIRGSIIKSNNGKLRALYDQYRPIYDAKYPDRPKLFNYKAAQRIAQKILYACLWEQWRLAYNLPAPWPYAFDILKHNPGHRITIADLYDK